MSRPKWLLPAIAAVAAVTAAGALLSGRSGAAGASSLAAAPEGWLAARTYLVRRGTRVDLLDRPLDRSASSDPLVLAFPGQGFPARGELDALRRRLSSGGTIVFAYSGRRGFLEAQIAEALGLTFAPARGDPPLSPRAWYAFASQQWRLVPDPASGPEGREVVIHGLDLVAKAPAQAQVSYRHGAVAVVFSYPRGRGRVLVVPSDALSNARLSNPGNSDLLESLRAALPGRIVFDEYHHGLVAPAAAAAAGSASSLDLLLASLVLLYLLGTWTLARRFGPSWEEPPRIVSSTSSFLLGLGALHRELRHCADAALRMMENAESLDPRLSIPAGLREAAAEGRESSFLELARSVARLQGRRS